MNFVADASCTLPWVLRDESSPWSDALLLRARSGSDLVVPAHWAAEVLNGILVAERRKRIPAGTARRSWAFVSSLPVQVQEPLHSSQIEAVLRLAERHGLTIYDAIYLELSQRLSLPLATLDRAIVEAANRDGSPLVP